MTKLNTMCLTCAKCGHECHGTTCKAWTGCVYYQEDKNKRIWNIYKRDLIKSAKFTNREANKIRFNVIQYVCKFPGLDPVLMAADLQSDGLEIVYDDTSISKKENAAYRAAVNRARRDNK